MTRRSVFNFLKQNSYLHSYPFLHRYLAFNRLKFSNMSQPEVNSQEFFLLNDKCVIVDNNDKETGDLIIKKECIDV